MSKQGFLGQVKNKQQNEKAILAQAIILIHSVYNSDTEKPKSIHLIVKQLYINVFERFFHPQTQQFQINYNQIDSLSSNSVQNRFSTIKNSQDDKTLISKGIKQIKNQKRQNPQKSENIKLIKSNFKQIVDKSIKQGIKQDIKQDSIHKTFIQSDQQSFNQLSESQKQTQRLVDQLCVWKQIPFRSDSSNTHEQQFNKKLSNQQFYKNFSIIQDKINNLKINMKHRNFFVYHFNIPPKINRFFMRKFQHTNQILAEIRLLVLFILEFYKFQQLINFQTTKSQLQVLSSPQNLQGSSLQQNLRVQSLSQNLRVQLLSQNTLNNLINLSKKQVLIKKKTFQTSMKAFQKSNRIVFKHLRGKKCHISFFYPLKILIQHIERILITIYHKNIEQLTKQQYELLSFYFFLFDRFQPKVQKIILIFFKANFRIGRIQDFYQVITEKTIYYIYNLIRKIIQEVVSQYQKHPQPLSNSKIKFAQTRAILKYFTYEQNQQITFFGLQSGIKTYQALSHIHKDNNIQNFWSQNFQIEFIKLFMTLKDEKKVSQHLKMHFYGFTRINKKLKTQQIKYQNFHSYFQRNYRIMLNIAIYSIQKDYFQLLRHKNILKVSYYQHKFLNLNCDQRRLFKCSRYCRNALLMLFDYYINVWHKRLLNNQDKQQSQLTQKIVEYRYHYIKYLIEAMVEGFHFKINQQILMKQNRSLLFDQLQNRQKLYYVRQSIYTKLRQKNIQKQTNQPIDYQQYMLNQVQYKKQNFSKFPIKRQNVDKFHINGLKYDKFLIKRQTIEKFKIQNIDEKVKQQNKNQFCIKQQAHQIIKQQAYQIVKQQTHQIINQQAHQIINQQVYQIIKYQAHKIIKQQQQTILKQEYIQQNFSIQNLRQQQSKETY